MSQLGDKERDKSQVGDKERDKFIVKGELMVEEPHSSVLGS
jgi:hypothetical protein